MLYLRSVAESPKPRQTTMELVCDLRSRILGRILRFAQVEIALMLLRYRIIILVLASAVQTAAAQAQRVELRDHPVGATEVVWSAPPSFEGVLHSAANVMLSVYDVLGRQIDRLAEGAYPPGHHEIGWTTAPAPGVYFVRLEAGVTTRTQRVTVVR